MRALALLGSCLVLLVAASAAPAGAAPAACSSRANDTPEELLDCVTVDGIHRHLEALQSIADGSGGNRAAGTPGYDRSIDYVAAQLAAAGYRVTREPFAVDVFAELAPPLLEQVAPAAEPLAASILRFAGSGDVTAPVIALPDPPADATPGCEDRDFAPFAAGSIALVATGGCSFARKAANAAAAGAAGLVLYGLDPDGPAGTLGSNFAPELPAVAVERRLGLRLAARPGLVLHLRTETLRDTVVSQNLLAETGFGDPERVVLAGASLDSGSGGPGIQDNGSGAAALLEIALAMRHVRTSSRVRFAWWGAHDPGLVGSTIHLYGLTPDRLQRIALYLDLHAIAAPNHGTFIAADGTGGTPLEGSLLVARFLETLLRSRNQASLRIDLDGQSDHAAFLAAGIPAAGLTTVREGGKPPEEAARFGGAVGVAYDPCARLACDDLENLDPAALALNADVMARTLLHYAMNASALDRLRGSSGAAARSRAGKALADGLARLGPDRAR